MPTMFATAEEAELAFYDALARSDISRLAQVWADDEEVVCVHPGGLRIIGHQAVLESWQEILASGALRIQVSRQASLLSMMSVVHSVVETITVGPERAQEVAHCYATNIYHKGPTGWRIVMHHASAAPVEAGVLDMNEVPGLLH